MKICFIVPDVNPRGTMTGMIEMISAYRRQGVVVELITQDMSKYQKGVKSIIFGLVATIRYFKLNKKFDIIHTHGANGWCNIFFKLAKPKKVVTMHNCYAGELKATGHLMSKLQRLYWGFLSFLDKLTCKDADAVFAISKKIGTELIENNICDEKKIWIIYDGIDVKKFTGKGEKMKKIQIQTCRSILYAGRLAEAKGLENLIKAFKLVKEKVPDAKLYLTGKPNAYKKELADLVDKLKAKDIIFLGFVPHEQLLYLYKNTTCFVLPSLYEPFGLVAGEAMANNAVVLLSKNCGIVEVLDKNVAFVLDDLKPKTIANKLIYVLKNQNKLKPMRQRAREYVKTNINIDETAKKMLSIEKNIMEAK